MITRSSQAGLALIAASLCSGPAPASVPIGTPVQLGAGTQAAGSTTFPFTTTASSPAGATIIVAAGDNSTVGIPSIADSAGNVYTGGTLVTGSGSTRLRLFWCFYCIALPNGGTITITYGNTGGVKLAGGISVTGLNNLDLDGPGAFGTGGGGTGSLPTITTSALGQPAELVIGAIVINAGAPDSFTEASGFNSNTSALNGSALRWAYQVVNAKSAITYAPTLGTSRVWSAQYATFEAKNCSLGSTGVGSC